jgi:hypothetical protein
MAKSDSEKCHSCGEYLSCCPRYIFVKCKGQPMRCYCEKCAKERGYHGSTGKGN